MCFDSFNIFNKVTRITLFNSVSLYNFIKRFGSRLIRHLTIFNKYHFCTFLGFLYQNILLLLILILGNLLILLKRCEGFLAFFGESREIAVGSERHLGKVAVFLHQGVEVKVLVLKTKLRRLNNQIIRLNLKIHLRYKILRIFERYLRIKF